MKDFVLRELTTKNIVSELEKIGFDESYKNVACNKFRYKNIKINDLTLAQANILKQLALTVGSDCAVHKDILTAQVDKTDVILGGSYSQLQKISEKLKHQPFNLKQLSNDILKILQPIDKKTKIIGILNVTPDSFSDGGIYLDKKYAIEHVYKMLEDGADGIDIGAESTRPNAEDVEPNIQIDRLKPILKELQKNNILIPISIDTRSSEVAIFALEQGIKIINDVSGLSFDKNMATILSEYKAKVIIQHAKNSINSSDIVECVFLDLRNKIEYAKECGINDIIIDPGIGFGKNKEQNFEIIKRIEELYSLNYPIMLGISRKSFLGVSSNDNILKDALSLAVGMLPLTKGIDYLRVHNVNYHKQLLKLL